MEFVRNQFTFYRSYYDAISRLPKKEQSEIILAVCGYAIYQKEPEGLSPVAWTAFELIRPTLDSGRKKAAAGMAGGKSKRQANAKQMPREKEVEVEVEKENEKEIEAEVEEEASDFSAAATERKLQVMNGKLGRGVVFLTDEQITSLLDKMGVDTFDFYVDKLSSFIIEKDAKIKNHYQTILKWWKEDTEC